MKVKIIISLLLLVSMVLVLEPSINALNKINETMLDWGVSRELVETRDNLIKQIIGYVLLYVSLFLGIWYSPEKQIRIESEEMQRRPKPESGKRILQEDSIPRKSILEGHSTIQYTIVVITFALTWLVSFIDSVKKNPSVSPLEYSATPLLIATIVAIVSAIIVKYL